MPESRLPGSAPIRTGIICNPKSHQNRTAPPAPFASRNTIVATPRTRTELADVLRGFARDRIELLVIDGGDGTVRDVLTSAGTVWTSHWPRIAIVPSGKTNALALDLGLPSDWTLEQALTAAQGDRVALRRPIEVLRRGETVPLRGFLFGTGAFVSATALAQRTHRVGAFNGVAVTLALGWAVLQTMFGAASGTWRSGEAMRLDATLADGGNVMQDGRRYLMLGSTLKRLPVGLKPFGKPRQGLKLLVIDAPPRRLVRAVPLLLAGSETPWLAASGYHRIDAEACTLAIEQDFILDGEVYPGGELTIRQAKPLRFVVP